MNNVDLVLWQCFRHFVHLDESNAVVHMSPVRYSPITFRLAEEIDDRFPFWGLTAGDVVLVETVMAAKGKYPEDAGRIAEDGTLPA